MNYIKRKTTAGQGRKAYFVSRRELACHLFPSPDPKLSVATLHRWIDGDPQLRQSLRRIGYQPRTRWFNRRIVETIQRFI